MLDGTGKTLLSETYFSIGGGFISTIAEIGQLSHLSKFEPVVAVFESANQMMKMSLDSKYSVSSMKRSNEQERMSEIELNQGLDAIDAMHLSRKRTDHGRKVTGWAQYRRSCSCFTSRQLQNQPDKANMNDWLCAYAMAVNEENAAGHMAVTAPTNGAAGVIPAVIYYLVKHEGITRITSA